MTSVFLEITILNIKLQLLIILEKSGEIIVLYA